MVMKGTPGNHCTNLLTGGKRRQMSQGHIVGRQFDKNAISYGDIVNGDEDYDYLHYDRRPLRRSHYSYNVIIILMLL